MTSARPFDAASRVANRWNTRTGSSELNTVTAEPSRIRSVDQRRQPAGIQGKTANLPVELTNSKDIDADLIGEYAFIDDVPNHLRIRLELTGTILGDITKCVQSELNHEHQPLSQDKNIPRNRIIPELLYRPARCNTLSPAGQTILPLAGIGTNRPSVLAASYLALESFVGSQFFR